MQVYHDHLDNGWRPVAVNRLALDGANETRPFVDTTVAKLMLSRMRLTHAETGISVISGPGGIGKTTTIDAFAAEHELQCVVVKVEPGTTKRSHAHALQMQDAIDSDFPQFENP